VTDTEGEVLCVANEKKAVSIVFKRIFGKVFTDPVYAFYEYQDKVILKSKPSLLLDYHRILGKDQHLAKKTEKF
jgi:hypothetical protein